MKGYTAYDAEPHAYLLEEVSHTGGTHADKHLHKLGRIDGQEIDSCLSSYSPGQQGLASTWGPTQQHPLGDACTRLLEPLGLQEEVHHLHQLVLHKPRVLART